MSYNHSEIIRIGNATAIVDGVKDKCDHAFDEPAYVCEDGTVLLERHYRCPTDEETNKFIQRTVDKMGTWIVEGTSACVKCGKLYQPNFNDYENSL